MTARYLSVLRKWWGLFSTNNCGPLKNSKTSMLLSSLYVFIDEWLVRLCIARHQLRLPVVVRPFEWILWKLFSLSLVLHTYTVSHWKRGTNFKIFQSNYSEVCSCKLQNCYPELFIFCNSYISSKKHWENY